MRINQLLQVSISIFSEKKLIVKGRGYLEIMESAWENSGKAVIAWKDYDVVINGIQFLWFFTYSKRKKLESKRKKEVANDKPFALISYSEF